MAQGVLTEKKHIYELDYIRAISAMLVVLYHYTTQYQNSIGHIASWPISFEWGAWAVNTFFLLSGYLTLRNFKEGGWRFLYKRFARLWPAFVVCVIITSLFMWVLMPERLRSVTDILLNFTMVPTYLGAQAVDGAYWTLPLELLFYGIIMVLMTKKLLPHLLKCLYGWAAVIATVSLCRRIGFAPFPLRAVWLLLIGNRGECFILGCAVALWQKGCNWKKLLPLTVLCAANSLMNMGIGITLWTLCFAAVILGVDLGKLRFAQTPGILGKCLVFLAKISYPLYLLHQFIGFAIIRKLELAGFTAQWWIVVPIAVSIALSAMVHYWVELPTARVLLGLEKKITLRLKARRCGQDE